MKKKLVKMLNNGVYRLFWKQKHGGGSSVASVGLDAEGNKWFQPSNWVSKKASTDWSMVKKAEIIEEQ